MWLNERVLVTSYTDGRIKLYDVNHEHEISTFANFSHLEDVTVPKPRDLINSISVNSQLGIIGAAYEDHYARIFDVTSNKLVSSVVAHQDSCSSISIDPVGLSFVTASHSNTIRLWSLETKACIQEISQAHQRKQDESIHAVKFHPTRGRIIGSCGVDAIVKLYHC